jgi:hypothetical protein
VDLRDSDGHVQVGAFSDNKSEAAVHEMQLIAHLQDGGLEVQHVAEVPFV